MKRNHGAVRPVPLDGLDRLRVPRALNSTDTQEKQSWFRIKNMWDEDDDAASTQTTTDGRTAEVYIYDEIGGWFGVTASDFIAAINQLDVDTINLHINSPGGSVFDGVAIYNALLQHKARIVVSVDSLAASAASFIAQAGDEIIMRRASTMMIHDGSMGVFGDAAYLRQNAEILDKLSNNIASIYAARAGGTEAEWRAVMIGEAWYTANEAVEAGLADSVAEGGEPAENKFDLSAFNFAGRSAAPSPDLIRQSVIQNRLNKETPVGTKPLNDTTEPVTPQPEVPVTPTEPVVAPAEEETAPDAESVPPTTPVPSDSVNRSGSFAVMVNGLPTSDPSAIQSHINQLEGFYNESRASAREEFIDSLAQKGSITGPQVDSLKKLVALDAMNDAQFTVFKDAYKNAPQLPLLARHGRQASDSLNEASALDQEIEELQAIVDRHTLAGKDESIIKNMPSWQKLQALLAQKAATDAGQGS